MTKSKLFGIACLLSLPAIASAAPSHADGSIAEPFEWEDVFAQQVSFSGNFVMAQDIMGNTYSYNTLTGDIITYPETYPGDSNCIADNGVMVGQSADSNKAVIMAGGKVTIPSVFDKYGTCHLNSITADGSLAAGYVSVEAEPMYRPVVVELNPDGTVKSLTELPAPQKDFTNLPPQGTVLHAMSQDGSVIGALTRDNFGDKDFPVIYTRGDDGSWTYTLPTSDLPAAEQWFGGSMAISPDGKYMATCQLSTYSGDSSTKEDIYKIWLFDVQEGSGAPLKYSQSLLVPNQILSDGTILATSSSEAFFPWTSYMYLPGAEDFVLFTDWLQENIEEDYYWFEDKLGTYGVIGYDDDDNPLYGDYIISGMISVADDFSVIVGGLPLMPNMLSYVFTDPDRFYAPEAEITVPTQGQELFYGLVQVTWGFYGLEPTDKPLTGTFTFPDGSTKQATGLIQDGNPEGEMASKYPVVPTTEHNVLNFLNVNIDSDFNQIDMNGRTYLDIPAGIVKINGETLNPAVKLSFFIGEGDENGIDAVSSDDDALYFDLQGRPVAEPGQGFFIKISKGNSKVVRY